VSLYHHTIRVIPYEHFRMRGFECMISRFFEFHVSAKRNELTIFFDNLLARAKELRMEIEYPVQRSREVFFAWFICNIDFVCRHVYYIDSVRPDEFPDKKDQLSVRINVNGYAEAVRMDYGLVLLFWVHYSRPPAMAFGVRHGAQGPRCRRQAWPKQFVRPHALSSASGQDLWCGYSAPAPLNPLWPFVGGKAVSRVAV
jgi:hypothetical protein